MNLKYTRKTPWSTRHVEALRWVSIAILCTISLSFQTPVKIRTIFLKALVSRQKNFSYNVDICSLWYSKTNRTFGKTIFKKSHFEVKGLCWYERIFLWKYSETAYEITNLQLQEVMSKKTFFQSFRNCHSHYASNICIKTTNNWHDIRPLIFFIHEL